MGNTLLGGICAPNCEGSSRSSDREAQRCEICGAHKIEMFLLQGARSAQLPRFFCWVARRSAFMREPMRTAWDEFKLFVISNRYFLMSLRMEEESKCVSPSPPKLLALHISLSLISLLSVLVKANVDSKRSWNVLGLDMGKQGVASLVSLLLSPLFSLFLAPQVGSCAVAAGYTCAAARSRPFVQTFQVTGCSWEMVLTVVDLGLGTLIAIATSRLVVGYCRDRLIATKASRDAAMSSPPPARRSVPTGIPAGVRCERQERDGPRGCGI